MLPSYGLMLVLATLPLVPWTTVQESVSAAEAEWQQLQEAVTLKILRHKQKVAEGSPPESFQGEIASIGAYIRKHLDSDPDFAWSAKVFLATQVLSDALGRHREAVQVLREVVAKAEHPVLAGAAAVQAAQILTTLEDEPGLRQLAEAYRRRENREAQFEQALDDFLTRIQLRPGKPFPELELSCLDDTTKSCHQTGAVVMLVLFFNVEHDGSVAALRRVQAAYAELQEQGLAVRAISLDPEVEALRARLAAEGVTFPVAFDGKGWESPAAQRCAVTRLPASFLLDARGIILHVGGHGAGLKELLRLTLAQQSAEKEQ